MMMPLDAHLHCLRGATQASHIEGARVWAACGYDTTPCRVSRSGNGAYEKSIPSFRPILVIKDLFVLEMGAVGGPFGHPAALGYPFGFRARGSGSHGSDFGSPVAPRWPNSGFGTMRALERPQRQGVDLAARRRTIIVKHLWRNAVAIAKFLRALGGGKQEALSILHTAPRDGVPTRETPL